MAVPRIGSKSDPRVPLPRKAAVALVDSMGREYYAALLSLEPHLATSYKIEGYDDRLSLYSERRISSLIRKSTRIGRTLDSFEEDSLTMEAWIDYKALKAEIAYRMWLFSEIEIHRRSPLIYADCCIQAIRTLVEGPDRDGLEADLESRLAMIPDVVLHVHREVDAPIALHAVVAADRLRRFVTYVEGLPDTLAPRGIDLDDGIFGRARSSLIDFADHCESLATTGDPHFALGYDGFAGLMRKRHMIEEPPEMMIDYARGELESALERRGSYSESSGRPSSIRSPAGLYAETLEAATAAAQAHPSYTRHLQRNPIALGGWAFRAVETALQSEDRGNLDAATANRWIIFRSALGIADVRMQTGEFTLDTAVSFVLNQTGAPRERVVEEVRACAVEPGLAIGYLIGKREIGRIEAELQGIMADGFTPEAFRRTVWSCGLLPPFLLKTCATSMAVGRR
jgi:hypothetical protein